MLRDRRAFVVRLAVLVLAATVLAACGGADATSDAASRSSGANSSEQVPSTLILNGRAVAADGTRSAETPKLPTGARTTAGRGRVDLSKATRATADTEPPAPKLNDDGTIAIASDPFADTATRPQALPIEDDASTTAGIEQFAAATRRVDRTEWNRWMNATGFFGRDELPSAVSGVVRIYVERCGGARTVATGVVLADETVVTTVHVVESPSSRVLVAPASGGTRIGAMVRYLDVDDDIAVLKVPGLRATPMGFHRPSGTAPTWGYAFGVANGSLAGNITGTPVMVTMREGVIDREQPDGFAEQISDRSVQTLVGAVDTGYSGGPVVSTNDTTYRTGWGFHGLVRARVPFRSSTGGIVVPSRLVTDALDASDRLDTWYEHPVGACPQWYRGH